MTARSDTHGSSREMAGRFGNELRFGLARARAVIKFDRAFGLKACQEYGKGGLSVLDDQLENQDWLSAGRPAIAEVACYPYIALLPEGEVPLGDRTKVFRRICRVQNLPGSVGMEGIADQG